MWWSTYFALAINLIIIAFMPKRLTKVEIYVTWIIIVCINLSSDIILALYFKLYELDEPGIQFMVPRRMIIFARFCLSGGIFILSGKRNNKPSEAVKHLDGLFVFPD
ncbi:hypothetical protein [Paenibacillus koleovorans]|uniref:hypothetical protein n=1 Tax=Paenibacillus koleovorans TaxID=121608 RepID=UPI000FDB991C|nr:hypothetical protein [Paenibacillus koleovorans]